MRNDLSPHAASAHLDDFEAGMGDAFLGAAVEALVVEVNRWLPMATMLAWALGQGVGHNGRIASARCAASELIGV